MQERRRGMTEFEDVLETILEEYARRDSEGEFDTWEETDAFVKEKAEVLLAYVKEEPISKQKLSNSFNIGKDCKEESVSEELEEAMKHNAPNNIGIDDLLYWRNGFITGVNWQKENLWKPADGDDLPEIDREVIALLDNGKIVFAHRPPEFWDGKDIITGKVTRNYPKTYDKGGWNIPDVKYWLDCLMPKEIEL